MGHMGRWICWILILAIGLTGCGQTVPQTNVQGGETGKVDCMVAAPMDSLEIQYEGAVLPDLYCYAGGLFEKEKRNTWETYYCQGYDANEAAPALTESYVELLCQEYDFELICEPIFWSSSDGSRKYAEYALRYTGNAHVSDTPVISWHGEVACDVSVFVNCLDDTRMQRCCVDYARWLTVLDTGLRYGTEEKCDTYVGASFGAGLNRMKDGTYQTTDGRFSAAPGEAVFLVNGEKKTYTARMEWSEKEGQKRICAEDKFGVPQMGFHLPLAQQVTSGDIFTVQEMDTWTRASYESMPEHDTMFAVLHGGRYWLPNPGLFKDMSRFNARMMYWDEEAAVAVFYFCTQFRTAPEQIEGFVVVPMLSDPAAGNPSDADYVISKGEALEIQGPSVFGAGYNLWSWEYISGSEFSEMQNTQSQTCTLIGHKEGLVRIRVVYSYSVKEPDVLTGNETYAPKQKTEEYLIRITA